MFKGKILVTGAPLSPSTIMALSKADYKVGMAWDCQGQVREISNAGYNMVIVNEIDEISEEPAIPGAQICGQIRQASDAPILIISRDKDPHTLANAIAAGADYFLREPLHPVELVARIDALLRRHREIANYMPLQYQQQTVLSLAL
jgi:DNA-binding response OmpR family regulator